MNAISIYAPGHYDIYDSYGLIACQLARHLARLGVHVNALGMGRTDLESLPDELRAIVAQPIIPNLGGIFLGYPTGYAKHTNPLAHIGPRICVTMFESSKLPAGWSDALNSLDAVIVPSRFCAEVFAACGVTAPIHVIPLGIGEVYRYAERPPEGSRDRPLIFLAFLDRGERKGGMVAYKAFVKAFGEDMNYRLLLKARTRRNKNVTVQAAEPNVEIVGRDMTEQELYELYLRCDVLINPNKGEGFGLIPREFAATGGISLATDWGGTADDIDEWGISISYTLERADWTGHKNLAGQDLGEWAVCDRDAIAEQLLTIAHNRDYYRQQAAVKAHRAINLYSWRAFAEGVMEVWKGASGNWQPRQNVNDLDLILA